MVFRRFSLVVFSIFLICTTLSLQAQRCETQAYSKKYPGIEFYSHLSETYRTAKDTTSNEIIIIPVVIHVLYNTATQNISEAQILSQLQSLNDDYRKLNADASKVPAAFASLAGDAKIAFCLAKVDPSGKPTSGITRNFTNIQSWSADDGMKFSAQGGYNSWDSKRYLNIWVCNLFGRNLGYSSLPGSQADRDGVVIHYTAFGTTGTVVAPFNKGRTLTHEVAHWLGLKHIWGDANCGDDEVFDTPTQQVFNNGCPVFPHKSSCSINNEGDMFMNFMDFTDDACMYMFTKGQALRMRSHFATGGSRNSILNSVVCDSNTAQRGALPVQPSVTNNKITLSPNPAVKNVQIEANLSTDIIGKTIKIYNSYGVIVASRIANAMKTNIEIQHLSAGIYYVIIENGKAYKPMNFVKN